MLLTPNLFFPQYRFIETNLNDWLRAQAKTTPLTHPLLPAAAQELLNDLHVSSGAFTYGGYLEDRSWMWQKTYLDALGYHTHLGVDINVRSHTYVSLPFPVRVINRFIDTSDDVGWGGRLVVQADPDYPAIILGHLQASLPAEGSLIPANHPLGIVGTWPQNGNAFEHIHVQLLTPEALQQVRWDTLDGYGRPEDAVRYPDPLNTPVTR